MAKKSIPQEVKINRHSELSVEEKPLRKKTGRPSYDPSDMDLHVLGKEMLEWIKANKRNPEFVHMSQWYSEVKGIHRSKWHAIRQRTEFLQYYEQAMDFMACKTMMNKELNTAYGSRYLAIYEKDVRDHEKQIAKEKRGDELEESVMTLAKLKVMMDKGEISQK